MHVTDPEKFPLSASATYAPHTASLEEAKANAERLHLPNMMFVQPSTYGTDNSCLLHALRSVGPSASRGVVVFDPAQTSIDQLKQWHEQGVRGVRVNLKSVGRKLDKAELEETLVRYAEAIRPLQTWALQLYVDLEVVDEIVPLFDRLKVKMVFDHFGAPAQLASDLDSIPGWSSLRKLMRSPLAFVKVSAPYRFTKDHDYNELQPLTKALFRIRDGDGVVFASDWPHTRFDNVDIRTWIDRCVEWCDGDEKMKMKLFRDNARRLWDVEG